MKGIYFKEPYDPNPFMILALALLAILLYPILYIFDI